MSNEEINHYHVLTVNNFASIDEIKRAYKIQSLKLHPDKNRDNIEEATKAFDALKKSYDILKDDELRGKHNISLRAQIESQKRFADLNESRKRFREVLPTQSAQLGGEDKPTDEPSEECEPDGPHHIYQKFYTDCHGKYNF